MPHLYALGVSGTSLSVRYRNVMCMNDFECLLKEFLATNPHAIVSVIRVLHIVYKLDLMKTKHWTRKSGKEVLFASKRLDVAYVYHVS